LIQFSAWPRAVQALVDHPWAGDDETDVEPQAGGLNAGDRATLALPAFAPVRRLGKATHDLAILDRPVGAHRIGDTLDFGGERLVPVSPKR
jgi:hypothetical protein